MSRLEREIDEIRAPGRGRRRERAGGARRARADEEAERIRKDSEEEIARRLAAAKAELRRAAAEPHGHDRAARSSSARSTRRTASVFSTDSVERLKEARDERFRTSLRARLRRRPRRQDYDFGAFLAAGETLARRRSTPTRSCARSCSAPPCRGRPRARPSRELGGKAGHGRVRHRASSRSCCSNHRLLEAGARLPGAPRLERRGAGHPARRRSRSPEPLDGARAEDDRGRPRRAHGQDACGCRSTSNASHAGGFVARGGIQRVRRFGRPPRSGDSRRTSDREREPEMEIKADEITAILKQQLADYEKAIDVAEVGTVLSVGDGIARIYGLDKVMAGELVDFGHDIFGLRSEPRAGPGRRRAARRGVGGQGRTGGAPHAPHHPGARRAGAGRPRRGRARPAARRQGPDRDDRVVPDRAHRARRHRPPARQGARADGHQGDRRHDPDRPRPARAHHRRPPDRARRRSRSTRSSTRRARASSASTSRSARRSRRSPRSPRRSRSTARWSTRSSSRRPRRTRPRCCISPRTPAARWASGSSTTRSTR